MLFCSKLDLHQLQHVRFVEIWTNPSSTLLHLQKPFWARVTKWLDKHGIEIAHLSDKDIMLGIVRCDDDLFVNHVILVAKQYLYYCGQKRFLPSIRV